MSVKVRKFRRNGYEVDIIVRLPDGTRLRERKKTPCTSKSAAQRWGEERQAILLLHGKPRRKEVPTLEAFAPRYMAEHVKANRHKPSTQSLKEHIIDFYLKPRWARRRLDDIHDSDVQKLKAELAELSPKTVNNVLCVLNTMLKVAVEWGVLEEMPARYMHLSPAAKSAAIRLLDRGADLAAEDLKDTENGGDIVETAAPPPEIPSNSVQLVGRGDRI
jgi:hypothetical protein